MNPSPRRGVKGCQRRLSRKRACFARALDFKNTTKIQRGASHREGRKAGILDGRIKNHERYLATFQQGRLFPPFRVPLHPKSYRFIFFLRGRRRWSVGTKLFAGFGFQQKKKKVGVVLGLWVSGVLVFQWFAGFVRFFLSAVSGFLCFVSRLCMFFVRFLGVLRCFACL